MNEATSSLSPTFKNLAETLAFCLMPVTRQKRNSTDLKTYKVFCFGSSVTLEAGESPFYVFSDMNISDLAENLISERVSPKPLEKELK